MPIPSPYLAGASLALLMLPGSVMAETLKQSSPEQPLLDRSHFQIDDEDPLSNLPTQEEANRAPIWFADMLNELGMRIEVARKRGDYEGAVKFDRAWAAVSGPHAGGYSALCSDLAQLERRDEAVQACGQALERNGVTQLDFARFVRLVLARPEGLDPTELEDARNAIEHLKSDASSRVLGYELQCELSLVLKDEASQQECSRELARLAPDSAGALTYAWSEALKKQDYLGARALIEKARQKGTMGAAVAMMENSTREFESQASALPAAQASMWRWVLAVAAALVALYFVARRFGRETRSAP